MSDTSFTTSAPYVRQVFETSKETDSNGVVSQVELPGFLELCVDVNGVPWVVARRKAPGLLADIARVATTAATPSAPVESPPQPPAV
jgi:hypothetical protein